MGDCIDQDLSSFARRMGYRFDDSSLLRRALTHSSARVGRAGSEDNERLEFLGDRVLGLAIAELLGERFPDAAEGELARRFNRLVRKETCAAVAEELELGPHVVMSSGEAESGGRRKMTILGDACEAVLGAVFLDGGFEPARAIIRAFWLPKLLDSEAIPTDAKSALQEWAQGRGLPLPKYLEIAKQGPDHAPRFTSEVHIVGLNPARGEGRNKRIAEQTAAGAMLVREGIWDMLPDG